MVDDRVTTAVVSVECFVDIDEMVIVVGIVVLTGWSVVR